jgi:hypothetical protein
VGSLGNPHSSYAELLALVARQKLRPARLVTREIAFGDVTATLERMTRFDMVGFESSRGRLRRRCARSPRRELAFAREESRPRWIAGNATLTRV